MLQIISEIGPILTIALVAIALTFLTLAAGAIMAFLPESERERGARAAREAYAQMSFVYHDHDAASAARMMVAS